MHLHTRIYIEFTYTYIYRVEDPFAKNRQHVSPYSQSQFGKKKKGKQRRVWGLAAHMGWLSLVGFLKI